MNKFARFSLVGTAVAALANLSHAADGGAVDVSAVVGTISAQTTPVGLIGVAILAVVVAVAAFTWIRKGIH